MKREKKNGKLDKRNLLLAEREYDDIRPDEIYGNVLSLKASQANVPYPLTGNLSPWKDQSRGYEVALANSVVNGDFSQGTTGWNPMGSTISVANNTLSVVGNGTDPNPRVAKTVFTNTTSKWRARCYVRVTNSVCQNITLRAASGINFQLLSSPVQNQWYELSGIVQNAGIGTNLHISSQYADNATANGKVMEIQTVMVNDLTTPFTATREPSIPDIQRAMEEAGVTFWNGTKTLRFRNNAVLSNFAGTATSGWVQEWIECQTGAEKSVVNLLGALGDFEGADLTGYGVGAGSPVLSSTVAKTGIKSLKCFGTGSTIVVKESNATNGDKMYVCSYVYITRYVAGQVGVVAFDKGGVSNGFYGLANTTLLNQWQFVSTLKTVTNGGINSYCGNYSAANADAYHDDFMHINLTTIFGPGNEPTQPEMDKIVQRAIAAYGYINTRTLKLARRWMLRLDGSDDFLSLTNSIPLDLGVVAGKEQAWAVTFRVPSNGQQGYALSKNATVGPDMQYGMQYDPIGVFRLFLNGNVRSDTGALSIAPNEFYTAVFYRNSAGLITPYLQKMPKPTAIYPDALIPQPNVRIGRRETAAFHFKGDIVDINMYEADKLDINQILRAEWNVARDYIA